MAFFKGWFGEKKTAWKLSLWLNRKRYKKFHSMIIPTSNGTSQIDHIVVSAFGVFIIETKNMKGWIFGSEDRAKWTQVVFKKKYRHQNPLRQTYRQKKCLAEFLDIHESYIQTIIYFNGDCVFKTPQPANVINYGLIRYIKRFSHKVLSENEIVKIIEKLNLHQRESKLTKRDHIRSLHQRHNSTTTCPRCGSALVLRKALKGPKAGSQFLGCETFPSCRFSKSA